MQALQHKQHVATDLLRVANMYNNILYPKNYYRHGNYKENDIQMSFGNFNNACRSLQIVNPYDPYDLAAVLKDIRFVIQDQKQISEEIYREYGLYNVDALIRKYGPFHNLIQMLKQEKPIPTVYPVYSRKRFGINKRLVWCHHDR